MAEATQEKQVEQSEQLKELNTSLTAITQQLVISNSLDGDTKKEFQKANQGILEAILRSNVLAETGDNDDDKSEAKSGKTEGSRWKNLLGHFGWAKKFAERSAKLAKLAASSTVKFGKTKLAKVTKFAGNMLDLLLKGLGLGILWALFKWLEGKDWDGIVKDVRKAVEAIGLDWDATVATLESIKTTLTEWGGLVGGIWTTVKAWKLIGWIASFGTSSLALMWAALKGIFGLGGLFAGALKTVLVWSGTLMFGEEGGLRKLWKAIKSLFGPGSKIAGSAINAQGWNESNMFKKEGALHKLWGWIKQIFSAEGKIGKLFVWTTGKLGLMFGETGPLRGVWTWARNIFGAEGKIAGMWKALKESKAVTTLFGEGSHLRRLMTWIGSFFGPESNLGKAATWIGGKVKLVKDYLMVGEAGKGGAISRLFGTIGGWFSGIGDGWKSMQKAKWFTGIKTFLGAGKSVLSAILVPLRFLLLPITWILGIGAAVMGFVNGFMGKEGVKDERSLTTKILDGLKGGFKGLLDFFVIDLVVMVQDLLNFLVEKVNKYAKYIPGFDGFEKFTFGDDLANATTEMLNMSKESAANVMKVSGKIEEGEKEPINIDKVLESAGGKSTKAGRSGSKYNIGIGKFGDAIDNLDMAGLAKMAEKMESLDKNQNVELLNSAGLKKRLQAEIKERAASIPAVEKAQQGGGGNNINAPVAVSKTSGTTTMVMGSNSTDKSSWKYGLNQ